MFNTTITLKSHIVNKKQKESVDNGDYVGYYNHIVKNKRRKEQEMKQDRIKRALHSFADRMDYKLQRKVYFYILGLTGGHESE